MRVLLISLGALFVVGVILATLRFWGLALPVSEFHSDFFIPRRPWLALEIKTPSEIESALKIEPEAILYFDVRLSSDNVLFVQAPHVFEQSLQDRRFKAEDYKGKTPVFYEFAFLKNQFPDIFPLESVLKKYPRSYFILNIIDNAKDIHKAVVDLLNKYQTGPRSLIQSDVDVVLKSIKELQPLWTFGTSQPEITRVLSLDSIGVLPAAEIRSDVFVTPLQLLKRDVFTLSLQNELRRRKKKIIIGPLNSWTEFEKARTFDVDGFIFRRFEDFQKAVAVLKLLSRQSPTDQPEDSLQKEPHILPNEHH